MNMNLGIRFSPGVFFFFFLIKVGSFQPFERPRAFGAAVVGDLLGDSAARESGSFLSKEHFELGSQLSEGSPVFSKRLFTAGTWAGKGPDLPVRHESALMSSESGKRIGL